MAWVQRALEYVVPGGKLNRGLSVIDSYRALQGGRALTDAEAHKCHVLGWCVEWLQAFFLVADDIMDQSVTRRGQPCWYKVPGVGNIAINDAFILESCIYKFLKHHFRQEPCYLDLIELLHETTYQVRPARRGARSAGGKKLTCGRGPRIARASVQTELGQLLDLITAPEDHVDLNRFSMAKYKWIVKYKVRGGGTVPACEGSRAHRAYACFARPSRWQTAYYSFYLPVAMAMLLAGTEKGAASGPRHFAGAESRGADRVGRCGALRPTNPRLDAVQAGRGDPAGHGRVLPDPGRLPGLLWRPRRHRQDRHGHSGQQVVGRV